MVITGSSLRYWFSDFQAFFDPLRDACCPTRKSIDDAKEQFAQRHSDDIRQWQKDAQPVEFVASLEERIDNPSAWEQLNAADVDELSRVAAEPPKPDLFGLTDAPKHQVYSKLSEQTLNFALSQLAGRPRADIRGLLDWSEQFESPASLKRFAEQQAGNVEKKFASQISDSLANSSLARETAEAAEKKIEDEVQPNGGRDKAIQNALKDTEEPIKTIKKGINDNAKAISDEVDTNRDKAIQDALKDTEEPIKTIKKGIKDNAKAIKDEVDTNRDKAIQDALKDSKEPIKTIKKGIKDNAKAIKDEVDTNRDKAIQDALKDTEEPIKTINETLDDHESRIENLEA
jgi:hypothetical protein